MPVTNYHSVNGVLIGESTGGVRTDYLTDALGSVTATMDQSANIKNTYRYKPYGDLLAKTGTDPDPKFMWNGSTGSRKTGLANSGQYNINRHYGTEQAAWTSRDPLWPDELAYVYVGGNPTSRIDPFGLYVKVPNPNGCGKPSLLVLIQTDLEKYGAYSGDWTGIVAQGGKIISGATAISLVDRPNVDCIAINGGLCGEPKDGWKEGNLSSPVGPCVDWQGSNYSDHFGRLPGKPAKIGEPSMLVKIQPENLGGGYVCAVDTPTKLMSRPTRRSGACVTPSGVIVAVIATNAIQTVEEFKNCMSKNCPPGSAGVFLDGGTSTQIVERPAGMSANVLFGGGSQANRPVHNWIVICG